MTPRTQNMVKGWCPGAWRPMESGDGLIVRVRPFTGALSIGEAFGVAEAARAFGNGHIDLTRRANLQIRGVRAAALRPLLDALGALGLLDADADAEAIRNVMVNPLAGIDPAESFDMRGIARALAASLTADPGLRALSGKFGFIADGGGVLGLEDERADIRLAAVRDGASPAIAIAIGLDGPDGTVWIGTAPPDRAADAALELARAFLALETGAKGHRVRHLTGAAFRAFARDAGHRLSPAGRGGERGAIEAPARRIGAFGLGGGRHAVGLGAPFGRIEATELQALCRALRAAGSDELRLSPWRVLYAPVSGAAGEEVLRAARAIGLMTNPADPLLRVEACPGAPSCPRAAGDTRALARRLAENLADADGPRRVHVSGCAKGCACSAVTDLVLVAEHGRYGVIRNGAASSPILFYAPEAVLMADPAVALGGAGAQGDV